MTDKNLVLTKMGGGLPEKIQLMSFNGFVRSDLCKADGARFVAMFEAGTKIEKMQKFWEKQSKDHNLDYIVMKDPESGAVVGIQLFGKKTIPQFKDQIPILRRRLKRVTPKKDLTSKLQAHVAGKKAELERENLKWSWGARIGIAALIFLTLAPPAAVGVGWFAFPQEFKACWDAGNQVLLPYLQKCIGLDTNG